MAAMTDSVDSLAPRRPAGRRLPGDLAIWFFILAEMLAFAVFFAAYAFARANNVELFNEYQQTLDRNRAR
jgi:nitric oxide reductase NorE protein